MGEQDAVGDISTLALLSLADSERLIKVNLKQHRTALGYADQTLVLLSSFFVPFGSLFPSTASIFHPVFSSSSCLPLLRLSHPTSFLQRSVSTGPQWIVANLMPSCSAHQHCIPQRQTNAHIRNTLNLIRQ